MAGDKMVRLSQLISILCSYPEQPFSSEEFAHLCGAPVAVINDDLEKLSYWFPIYSPGSEDENKDEPKLWQHGTPNNGVQPAFRLSVREAMELLNCLEQEQEPIIRGIAERLKPALATSGEQSIENKKVRRIFKGDKPPYDYLQPSEFIYELAELCGRRKLDLTYRDQKGELSRRTVDPLGIVYCWTAGAWYLITYSLANEDYRHFRVERIVDAKDVGPITEHKNFCLQEHLAPAWGVQVTNELYNVKIRFYDEFNVFSRVRKETQGRRFAELEEEPAGTLLYTDLVAGLKEIRVWVRSFGASAEVLEPQKLRQEVIESYKRILDRYK